MKLYHVLAIIPLAISAIVVSLIIQLKYEEFKETESSVLYCETSETYFRIVIDKASQLINKQALIVEIQRRVIRRIGTSPCVERALIAFRRDYKLEALLRSQAVGSNRQPAVVKAARTPRP